MTTLTLGSYRWRLLALSLGMLLPSLGTSIANVALPSLAVSFDATFPQVQWVVIAYLLAVTTLVVGAGRFGDIFGRRRLLLIGMAVFALASFASAASFNLWSLIASRALQGVGTAVIMALTMAAVGDAVPENRTGSVIGLLGTVSAVGTALGPTLGGVLLGWLGWPAIFATMGLFGVAAFALNLRLLGPDASASAERASFDVPGLVLLVLVLGSYTLTTTPGAIAALAPALLAVAGLSLAAFIAVESRTATPLVRLDQLRDRALSPALLALTLVTTIVMATLVVGPFYLTEGAGLGTAQVGLVMSVGPGVAALVGIPAGRLVDRLGAVAAGIAGLAAVTIGCAAMVALLPLFGVVAYVTALIPITGGYALFQAANNTSIMKAAPPDQRGIRSALLGLSRNLGLVTGASAMGSVFSTGSLGVPFLGIDPGVVSGAQATFAVAALLAAAALGLTIHARAR